MIGLNVYKILFLTEIIIAEFLFTLRLPRRKNFWLRLAVSLAVCYAVAFLYPVNFIFSTTSWYSSIMFFLLFSVTFVAILFMFDVPFGRAFFCAVTAYTIQHLSYGLVSILFEAFGNIKIDSMYVQTGFDFSTFDLGSVIIILAYISIFMLVYWGSYLILDPKLKNADDLKVNGKFLLLIVLLFIVDIVLNAVIIYNSEKAVYEYVVAVYNVLCCLLIFYIQLSIIHTKDMNIEIERMKEALRQAERQYVLQKENINLINIKCHDMKHQIRKFATQGGLDSQYIAEIEDLINIYDSTVKTGNEVLDIILTEKSLLCCKEKIKLNCMVDAHGLQKIKEGDLYALFGNIIDNSIEAVSKIDEVDKRCIGLNVHSIKKFVTIKIDNYFKGEVDFTPDGLPKTTKKDKSYHGFGMKSISAIVEKYGGILNVYVENETFILTIVFPNLADF